MVFFFFFTDRLVHSLEYNKLKALKPVSSLHLYFFNFIFAESQTKYIKYLINAIT